MLFPFVVVGWFRYSNKAEFIAFCWESGKILSLASNLEEFRRSGEVQWHRSSEKLPDRFGWLDLWESGLRCRRGVCVVLAAPNPLCFGLGGEVKLKG